VWGTVLILLIGIVLLLKVTSKFEKYFYNVERSESIMAYILDVCSSIAQTGVNFLSEYTPTRVVLMTLIVSTYFFYNYYTSSIIGALLSSDVRGPENVRELIDSPLVFTFENVGYVKTVLKVMKVSSNNLYFLLKVKALKIIF
jgi:hypothetical protein